MVAPGETITENKGYVEDNHGTIINNAAISPGTVLFLNDGPSVYKDGGTVLNNENSGIIGKQDDPDSGNYGKVVYNDGTIFYNQAGGEVTNNTAGSVVDVNNGTIVTNAAKDGDTAAGQVNTNNGMITTNNGNVTNNGTEDNSNATIVTNNGVVTNNSGKIGVIEGNIATGGNYGKVENNTSTGEIQWNQTNGEITNNDGLVRVNGDGATVVNNLSGGEIKQNHGTVSVNSGTIDNNFNKVSINAGTITSNQGDVEVNLGGEIQGNLPATNFLSVTVLFDTDSIGASVGSGFCSKDEIAMYCGLPIEKLPDIPENRFLIYDQGSNGTEELAENKAATVFVVADENYKLEEPTVSGTFNANDEGFSITGDSSIWTIKFTKLFSNIKINVTGTKITPPDDDDPVVPPKPDPKPSSPMFVTTYKLKFDLDGGVLDGETELEMKCSAGQRITLPEAPTKDGFTFAGWQTEIRGKKVVFEAGEKFTVTAAKTFVALWIEDQA